MTVSGKPLAWQSDDATQELTVDGELWVQSDDPYCWGVVQLTEELLETWREAIA